VFAERIQSHGVSDLVVTKPEYSRWANPKSGSFWIGNCWSSICSLGESKVTKLIDFIVVGLEYTRWANFGGIYLCEFQWFTHRVSYLVVGRVRPIWMNDFKETIWCGCQNFKEKVYMVVSLVYALTSLHSPTLYIFVSFMKYFLSVNKVIILIDICIVLNFTRK